MKTRHLVLKTIRRGSNCRCPEVNKRSFARRKQALTFASRMQKDFGVIQRIYKCPFCKDYHLTTQEAL